jgi:transposase
MYVRTVNVPSSSGAVNQYVRIVQAYRDGGKVKQRVIADLGRADVLAPLLPKLQRLLAGGQVAGHDSGDTSTTQDVKALEAPAWGPMLVVRELARRLGLMQILQAAMGSGEDDPAVAPPVERALMLVANRLIRPGSEHALAGWLESDWVCDGKGRRLTPCWQRKGRVKVAHQQLDRWYRTLDRLARVKDRVEVSLYQRLRDLFSLQVDLVLYDITSTYFEGSGPEGLAGFGHSRDGKPQNRQIVVGVVMAAGWPIAHHVFAGNTVDGKTVKQVVDDLGERFGLGRVVFVGDRGMVSAKNLKELDGDGHGYLVGLRRRNNPKVDAWLQQVDEQAWTDCPGGINARERKEPLATRVQEIVMAGEDEPSTPDENKPSQRVFVIHSDERQAYEQAQRNKSMQRTLEKLQKLKKRVDGGSLSDPEKIGASAARAMAAHHGGRYYRWEVREGKFHFEEDAGRLGAEKRLEGKYIIATSEKSFSAVEAVAAYKQLTEVERGFRSLKDVICLRPVWHHGPQRVKGHVFVAALALLLERLLERTLKDAGVLLSAREALLAVATIRYVRFDVAGQIRGGVTVGSEQAREVLAALGIQELRPPTPPRGQETVV